MQQSMQNSRLCPLREPYDIVGSTVKLRPLQEDDASDRYASWLNDPVVNRYLETRSVTVKELKDYIRAKREAADVLFLGIFSRDTGQHIGNVKLEPIDWEKKTAMVGLLIGDKEYWGKGVGTEVTNLITDLAFTKLGLNEVTLGVIPENMPAIRVYEKCGFTVLKVNKGAITHDGVLHDQIIMGKRASRVGKNFPSPEGGD